MTNNKRFFKTISLAHWHVKLSIAAQLPMVLSFRWEQTCKLVINVKNNVVKKIRLLGLLDVRDHSATIYTC